MVKLGLPECSECNIRMKSIFCELSVNEVQTLNDAKKNIKFKKGQTIYYEDSYPRCLYCINYGMVKITQMGIDGKEQIVHLAHTGDIIGYSAILCGDKYSSTAVAMEDTSLCIIPIDLFFTYVKQNQNVAFKLIHLFSKNLKDAEKKIINIIQRPVKERIAQSLLLLKESYGYESDGRTLKISIKRDELASIAGTTRETATRILLDLKKKKIIELSGKKIIIIKHTELLKIAKVI